MKSFVLWICIFYKYKSGPISSVYRLSSSLHEESEKEDFSRIRLRFCVFPL